MNCSESISLLADTSEVSIGAFEVSKDTFGISECIFGVSLDTSGSLLGAVGIVIDIF